MSLYQIVNDKAVVTAGTAAATYPWWKAILEHISEVAGLLLPILGVVLLFMQIVFKIRAQANKTE